MWVGCIDLKVPYVCQVEPGHSSEMHLRSGPRRQCNLELRFKHRKEIFVAFIEGFLYPALLITLNVLLVKSWQSLSLTQGCSVRSCRPPSRIAAG